MSLERDFFGRFRPAFGRLEAAGFRKAGEEALEDKYEYREPFLDGQFEAQLTVSADGTVRGQVIDLDTGEEYLPIRARHQVGGFVGTVREAYLEVLGRVRDNCFVPVEGKDAEGHVSGDAWIIPSNPKIYDIDAGFAAGGGCIEWHQHNNIKAGDELYIYSAAPNSAILYRCGVEAADLVYRGMFVESKGYERAMRIRLIEKYPKDRFPLSFIKANGGSAVRSARRMPQQLLEAMMEQWDSMIDQLFEKELDAYKVCPNCLEAVSAELECCPHCGTQLPDHTAAIQICPHCGAKNRIFDLKCANCGKELKLFPGANDESNQK